MAEAGHARNIDPRVAQAAADTLAWLARADLLIADKQRHYANRIRELRLEASAPPDLRRPDRIARIRGLALQALEDVRELLELVKDTMQNLPPQLLPAMSASSASTPSGRAAATEFLARLPAKPVAANGDCPICLDELSATGAGDVVCLPCGGGAHSFHRQCIMEWAALSAKCPLCRECFCNNLPPARSQPASPERSLNRTIELFSDRPAADSTSASSEAQSPTSQQHARLNELQVNRPQSSLRPPASAPPRDAQPPPINRVATRLPRASLCPPAARRSASVQAPRRPSHSPINISSAARRQPRQSLGMAGRGIVGGKPGTPTSSTPRPPRPSCEAERSTSQAPQQSACRRLSPENQRARNRFHGHVNQQAAACVKDETVAQRCRSPAA